MKTRFPLFARLLLWFFVNLAVLLLALWLTLRFEFGSQYHGFLPDSSRAQTQAMAEVLIGQLAQTGGDQWEGVLAQLSSAYKMQFALFDGQAKEIAGAVMQPPPEARSLILMTGKTSELNLPPPQEMQPDLPGPFRPPPPGSGVGPRPDLRPGPAPGQMIPFFPQHVLRTENPRTYWLLVHLPMNQLHLAGLDPAMLVGRTDHVGDSPLLFNPNPWFALAGGMIVFSTLFWLVLTRSLTNSIAKMTRATEAIAEGHFDSRAPEDRRDELGRLGFAINRMAARLKGFITGQRRFLGDVAHELTSPLARMEMALAILEERGDPQAAAYVRDVREEVTHMRKLAHELLSFTKAAIGENRVRLEAVSVAEVVEAVVRQEQGDAGPVRVSVPGTLYIRANRELLGRAIANLVRNALRYAGDRGPIVVSAWSEGAEVVVSVADEGPGVPAHELERLFDPFYRLDESRTTETGGTGLGLAIVKTCVEACQGTVTAMNREPHGLEVRVRCAAARGEPVAAA